nr:hypothetical protein [Tanacetum cinerariifolium]
MEDQPLPADASPIAPSSGYIAGSDPEEDPEEDPTDYPSDRGDDDDNESSADDDDDDDVRHLRLMSLLLHHPPLHTISFCHLRPSADDDDDDDVVKDDEDEEEEEHLAPTDPSSLQADDIEAFETDESAFTSPTSPHHIILSSETKSHTVRMFI